MKILVMCENLMQFNDYVQAALNDKSKLTRKTVKRNGCDIIIHIDDLEFIFCKNSLTLRGRSFGENDRIVKIGSWYNIPEKVQEDIVTQFMARTVK